MIAPGQPSDEVTLQAAFDRFHEDNPHVYAVLEDLARIWLRDHTKVGMKMLPEVSRWQLGVETGGVDYRLNNSYTSRYAGLLLANHPEWAGRIETRVLRAA